MELFNVFWARRCGDNEVSHPARRGWRCCLLVAVGIAISVDCLAGTTNRPATNLSDLSIEELVNLKVTSVSKQEENLNDAAAAIFVLSNDDIRRSGATSIAEALRWVPGLDVGAINSSQWAITSRGHNSPYANKLLVLVDGRVVYNPDFAGVFWDLQQTMLEDVDRIEVIRGPGATLWGANAVNGVINVVSRSARETQGGLIYGGGGAPHLALGGARYGGKLGADTYYRIYSGYQLNDDYQLSNGQSAHDGWQGWHGGMRVDHYPQAETHLTWQANATVADLDDHASDAYNVNTLGRWTREISERASVELQAYYDRTLRNDTARVGATADTFDLTAQHTFGLGERNNVIWGLGAQYIYNEFDQITELIVTPITHSDQKLFSFFVQDEFQLVPDKFTVTGGVKVEHNDFTGIEVQPSIRAAFKPAANQTVWAAASRAVRTPSVLEGQNAFAVAVGDPFVGPDDGLYVPRLTGNSEAGSEILWAFELGYRIQPSKHINIDLTAFYNDYEDLFTWSGSPTRFVPGTPVGIAELAWQNLLTGENYGGEASVTVTPVDSWRLIASYSLLLSEIHGPDMVNTVESSPVHKATLRSSWDFKKQASLDAQLRYVDEIDRVPAYVTADIRLSYRPTETLEFALVGQNLFQAQHKEATPAFFISAPEIPRGLYGRITWRF